MERAGRALFERNADPFLASPHKAAERPVSIRPYNQGEVFWDFGGGCCYVEHRASIRHIANHAGQGAAPELNRCGAQNALTCGVALIHKRSSGETLNPETFLFFKWLNSANELAEFGHSRISNRSVRKTRSRAGSLFSRQCAPEKSAKAAYLGILNYCALTIIDLKISATVLRLSGDAGSRHIAVFTCFPPARRRPARDTQLNFLI
jgi:hypothetical protein